MEENECRMIDREALFCSATEDYRIPPEPDEDQDVLLRFRTGRDNAEHVYYVEDGAEVEIDKVCLLYTSIHETGQVFEGFPPD